METLTKLRKETVEGLKKLVRMNHDAAKGFEDAGKRIERDDIESLFRTASDDRKRFANELMGALAMGVADVPEGGTTLGSFHRAWLNIRGALNGGDSEVVLKEASRGESALVDEYEDVLVGTAGSPVNDMLHEQLTSIRTMRDSINSLHETLSSA